MADSPVRLDDQQRRAVAARHNVVVSAGAGSGKTRVLTERYLELLRDGAEVSEILTLTFTRKAAAEMFQRIYRRLQQAAIDGDAHLARQLRRFDEAQISTLDSFCAGILRDTTSRFGLPPAIRSDEAELEREARRHALRLLSSSGDHPVLGAYVRQLGLGRALDELLVPLATRFFRVSAVVDFDDLAERQREWLEARRSEVEAEIDAAVGALLATTVNRSGAPEVREALTALQGRYGELGDYLANIDRRRLPNGDDGAEFKELLNRLHTKSSSRRTGLAVTWAEMAQTERRMDELRELYRVLAPFQEEVLESRRRQGLLSHQEVMELAVEALTVDEDLRRVYKERFRFVMIDEFQDNNATQRDLLFLLAERRDRRGITRPKPEDLEPAKLFFVGDQKQSIYRFRGADVAVFRGLADDIDRSLGDTVDASGDGASGPGSVVPPGLLSLDTNYRSEPLLIRFFNQLFPRVFGTPSEPWDAAFEPLGHRDAGPGAHPAVTLAWTVERDEDAESEEPLAGLNYAEAGWIAAEIRRLTVTEGSVRPGEIAILYRTSSSQQVLERMLRREGVPYRSQAVRSLFTEAPASDLYALLQLCFTPTDRAALTAYLRSPFAMVSDTTIAELLAAGTPWPVSPGDIPDGSGIPETDRLKIDRAVDLFERTRQRLDRVPLNEVLRGLWDEGGYRYAILHRSSDHPYLEHLAYLDALSLRYADRPAVEFVDYLRDEMGENEKIDELDVPGVEDAVQLMTIHKSKGLEFPVVFVSAIGGGQATHRGMIHADPDLGLTVRLPDPAPDERGENVFERHARDAETRQEEAELRRILYVAMTRAEQRLYLTASIGRTRRPRPMFDLLAPALGFDPWNGTVADEFSDMVSLVPVPRMTARELRERAVPQTARRTPADAAALLASAAVPERPDRETETTPSAVNAALNAADAADAAAAADAAPAPFGSVPAAASASGPAQGELFAEGDRGDSPGDTDSFGDGDSGEEDAGTLGTLTHALLERAVLEPVERDEWAQLPAWAERGLSPAAAGEVTAAMLDEAWDLARRFLDSPLWAHLRGGQIHAELPFLFVPEAVDVAISGTMDLVVERDDAVWVVDYKTNRELDPRTYQGQMSVYRAAAAHLFSRPVELRLFGLRRGEAYEVSDRMEDIVRLLQLP